MNQQVTPNDVRILVVEDDPDIASGTCRLLERAGYVTTTAPSAEAALEPMRAFKPHLVLLDRDLPGMDGMEFCRQIKRDSSFANVFVILTSGTYTQTEEQIAGLDSGADGYLVRPIANRELAARMEAFVRIVRLNKTLREQAATLQVNNESLQREIIERKRLEAQFLQAQKLEAVGQLAGGVAHDFRNQLTIIQGFTELLETGHHAPADSKHMFSEIHKAIGRSTTLVAQLMAFSRKQTLTAKLADVNQVIGELAGILPKLLGEDNHLAIVLASKPCMAIFDVVQLHQAIVNLANNARDAMPHGGTLTIQTSLVPAGDPLLRAQPDLPDRNYVAIHVRDTGTGMDEAICARIFEPFFTTKPVGEGTGLGLAMVHGFIHQSGGFITVDSRPGAGTEFHLYLPRTEAQDPAPAAVAETAMSPLPPASGTILVVEDAESLRMTAILSLSQRGYTVYGAESPAAALELLRREKIVPDLLVTDLVMPGGSGLDLAQAVLRLHPQVGILYMSGYAEKDLSARGLKEVPGAFLPKPFSIRQLSDAVRTVLASRGRQPAPASW